MITVALSSNFCTLGESVAMREPGVRSCLGVRIGVSNRSEVLLREGVEGAATTLKPCDPPSYTQCYVHVCRDSD